jgi:WD40 repeat protein
VTVPETGIVAASPTGVASSATATPTEMPPTPTLPALPVLAGTALPYPQDLIRPETMTRLRLLSTIGYGTGYIHGSTYGLRLTADERHLVAWTTAGVAVFSAQDLSLLHFIQESAHGAVSQDGTLAVFFDYDGARVWDLESGERIGGFPYAADEVFALAAVSLDNSLLALAYSSGEVDIVRLPDGEPVTRISQYVGTVGQVKDLVFEPSGKQLYFLFRDIDVGLQSVGFDTTSWAVKAFHFVDTTEFNYGYGVFAPTRSGGTGYRYGYFMSGWSGEIRVVDYETFGPRFDIPLKSPASTIGISNNSQWIAIGNAYNDQVEIWKEEQVRGPTLTFPGHGNLVWGTAVANDGKTAYSVGWDGLLRMWKAGSQVPEHEVVGFYPAVSNLVATHAAEVLLLSTNVGSLFEIDLPTGSLQRTFADSRQPRRRFWEQGSEGFGHELNDMNAEGVFGCPASLSEGDLLVAQGCQRFDVPIALWSYAQAQVTGTRPPPSSYGHNDVLALSPDGRWLAETYYLPTQRHDIWLYDLQGKVSPRVLKQAIEVDAMQFSPDSTLLAAAGVMGQAPSPVRVFDVASGSVVQEISVETEGGDGASHLAFSPDGSFLFVLAANTDLMVYDTGTWTVTHIHHPSNSIIDFAVAAQSPLVALVTDSNQLFLWNYQTDELSPPVAFPGMPWATWAVNVTFTRDDRFVAALGESNLVYVLGVSP